MAAVSRRPSDHAHRSRVGHGPAAPAPVRTSWTSWEAASDEGDAKARAAQLRQHQFDGGGLDERRAHLLRLRDLSIASHWPMVTADARSGYGNRSVTPAWAAIRCPSRATISRTCSPVVLCSRTKRSAAGACSTRAAGARVNRVSCVHGSGVWASEQTATPKPTSTASSAAVGVRLARASVAPHGRDEQQHERERPRREEVDQHVRERTPGAVAAGAEPEDADPAQSSPVSVVSRARSTLRAVATTSAAANVR